MDKFFGSPDAKPLIDNAQMKKIKELRAIEAKSGNPNVQSLELITQQGHLTYSEKMQSLKEIAENWEKSSLKTNDDFKGLKNFILTVQKLLKEIERLKKELRKLEDEDAIILGKDIVLKMNDLGKKISK